jgi:phage-related minor tail protein
MASSLRDDWKKFKAKYPDFEKSKSFKADLGPNLDAFAKAAESAKKNLKNALDDLYDMIKAMENVENISKSYGAVVESMGGPIEIKTKASKDWNEFQKDLVAVGKEVDDVARNVRNLSSNFDKSL